MTKTMNATEVLVNINACIAELENTKNGKVDYSRMTYRDYTGNDNVFRIGSVCHELSIFDWWKKYLSMSQLKQMKSFVETAIKLGFNGYVCFKVGARGCSHGMWAHTDESTDGFSPSTGDVLYHSFVSGENYYDMKLDNKWMCERLHTDDYKFTLKQIKAELKKEVA